MSVNACHKHGENKAYRYALESTDVCWRRHIQERRARCDAALVLARAELSEQVVPAPISLLETMARKMQMVVKARNGSLIGQLLTINMQETALKRSVVHWF